jgi:hypothetical protein
VALSTRWAGQKHARRRVPEGVTSAGIIDAGFPYLHRHPAVRLLFDGDASIEEVADLLTGGGHRQRRPVRFGAMEGPTAADEINLPVYRRSGPFVAHTDYHALSLSWSLNAKTGLQTKEASFYSDDISYSSAPSYPDVTWYQAKVDTEAVKGDWRLENFLRAHLDHRGVETAVQWEARVAQLWEIAAQEQNWETFQLNVDGRLEQAKALTISGRVFVRAVLPWGDLEIDTDVAHWSSGVALQRMTVEELQPLLDDHNARGRHP